MKDEQLLQHSPEEARQKFNDDQLERYNELKQQDLSEDLEDKKTEDGKQSIEGLAAMRESVEEELTVNVRGIEFIADIDDRQAKKLMDVAEHSDKKVDELPDNLAENIKSNILDILADRSVNYDRKDFEEHFGDAGINTIGTISAEFFNAVNEELDVKKNRLDVSQRKMERR